MKYIKLFEMYKNPLKILQGYKHDFTIDKCTVDSEGKISVDDYVLLDSLEIVKLDIQFKNITHGYFIIDNNHLITLKGCPENVDGFFSCSNNKTLMSLEYMPNAHEIFYNDCGCSEDPSQLQYIPIDVMKKGGAYNFYGSTKLKYFIYDLKDTDEYWDSILQKEPMVFEYLVYNRTNNNSKRSNFISRELAEKYKHLTRSKDILWGVKIKR